ncbi:hypothetical protein TEA_016403 [Camellia sinensis var. sinensis]|uniref:Photolyase/cryptochrome alpha/beta domain-containing protein n=1 Tax=Camellia sinensis var. sinensis TaxID=542762 RepID=A0A4S4EE33_CAMSN|nr:hypothetical protein TEA_016403 [Camellia sinensis var. sinensis]
MDSKNQTLEDPESQTPLEGQNQLVPTVPFASISVSLSTILPTHFLLPPKISPFLATHPNKVKIPSQISSLSHLSISSSLSPPKPFFKSTISSNPLQNPLSLNPRRPSDPSNAAGIRRASVVWFRNDLRVHDNECLNSANNESMSVLPVYCFDPRDYGKSSSGFDKTGPYRASFLIESVSDLRKNLQARGSDLVVRIGKPEMVLVELAKAIGAEAVYVNREVSNEEVKAEEKIEAAMRDEGVEVKYFWGSTLFHVDDLPFKLDEMPTNYGGFREKVQGLEIRKTMAALDQLKGLPSGGDVEAGEIPSLVELGLNPNATLGQCRCVGVVGKGERKWVFVWGVGVCLDNDNVECGGCFLRWVRFGVGCVMTSSPYTRSRDKTRLYVVAGSPSKKIGLRIQGRILFKQVKPIRSMPAAVVPRKMRLNYRSNIAGIVKIVTIAGLTEAYRPPEENPILVAI